MLPIQGSFHCVHTYHVLLWFVLFLLSSTYVRVVKFFFGCVFVWYGSFFSHGGVSWLWCWIMSGSWLGCCGIKWVFTVCHSQPSEPTSSRYSPWEGRGTDKRWVLGSSLTTKEIPGIFIASLHIRRCPWVLYIEGWELTKSLDIYKSSGDR